MADKIKETESLTKAVEKLNKTLENTEKVNDKIFKDYEKKAKKATKNTDDLSDSFKTFRKVMEGTSTKGLAVAMDDMPKYIKGVTKMTSSFADYTKEVGKTKDMFETMGISFNKTMRDLESKSSGVSKAMNMLVSRANKLASVKDSLVAVPKQLKEIQDSMRDTPEIKIASMEKLTEMVDGLKNKISDVDFKDIQGKMEKLGKGENVDGLVDKIQTKLGKIKVKPVDVGGEDAAKKAVSDIGAELNKLADLSPGDDLINGFLSSLGELSKDTTFSKITGKYKTEIEEFESLLSKPGVTYEEVSKSMIDLNGKLSASMSDYFDSFETKASFFEKQMVDIKKSQEELSDNFRDGYKLTFFTDEAVATFEGVMAQMSAEAYAIQANNIIPDEQLMKTKEMQEGLRKLTELNEKNRKIQDKLSASEGERKEVIDEIKKEQKESAKAIKAQVKHMKDLERLSSDYAKHLGEASESGFGQKQADGLSNKLFGISGSLKKMGADAGEGSKLGKGLSFLGDKAGKFGGSLRKLAFPVAVISGAISLGKLLLQLEARYAALSQEAVDTGALIGKSSADVGNAMDAMNIKATNLSGLYEAAKGGREFALSRKEIMGVASSLDQAGLASRNLEGQMKNVKTTAEGAGNEFLGAANVVTKFSHNLGLSKGVVAGMMGEMAFEFDSTMGTMNETFVDLTAAMDQSGMSSNRFFATVQSATAGLSFYEEQLSATAKMVAHLGKNTGLTDAEVAKVAKTVTEFGRNTDQAIKAFAIVQQTDPEAFGKMAEMAQKSIDDITVKMEKETDPKELKKLKAQRENALLMKEALDGKNITEAGTLLKYASADLQANVVGGLADFADKASKGMGIFEKEKMYDAMGIGELQRAAQARGESLGDSLKNQESISGDSAAQDDKAFNIDQKVGNARNKLIEGVQTRLTLGFGSVVTTLMMILAALTGGALFSKSIGKIFGKGGPGGGRGSGKFLDKAKGFFSKGKGGQAINYATGMPVKKPGMISKLAGKGKDVATTAAGFVSGKAASVTEGMAKAGSGVKTAIKGSKAVKAVSGAGRALKAGAKMLKLGRAIPILGSLIGAGFVAKEVWNIGEKMISGKNVSSGDMARLGMSALSMVPVVGTAATFADIGMDAAGGYDALSKATASTGTKTLTAGMSGRGIPKPGEALTGVAAGAGAVGAFGKTTPTLASAEGGRNVNNTNIFHINGGNPDEVKRIVLDTLVRHERQTS